MTPIIVPYMTSLKRLRLYSSDKMKGKKPFSHRCSADFMYTENVLNTLAHLLSQSVHWACSVLGHRGLCGHRALGCVGGSDLRQSLFRPAENGNMPNCSRVIRTRRPRLFAKLLRPHGYLTLQRSFEDLRAWASYFPDSP